MSLRNPLGELFALLLLAGCGRNTPAAADRETSSGVVKAAPARERPVPWPAPFAVVELFTSEGCSSCPPADRNLAALDGDAHARGLNVHVLSFHVDYWDDLGWRDPFSDTTHSLRQARYARELAAGRVYTPQMIVNGREEFVGSDRVKTRAAVARALEEPASVSLELRPALREGRLNVDYRLEGKTRDYTLNLAITQPVQGIRVERGENAGQTLAHDAVVRAFASYTLPREQVGSVSLPLPEGVEPGQATLVGYVVDPESLAIYGAASTPITQLGG